MMDPPYLAMRAVVLRRYPKAEVLPTATMYVVKDGDREIGHRAATVEKAWRNAFEIARANPHPDHATTSDGTVG